MLFKISWRNIWRSKLRSLVVVGSIVLGIWAMIFGTGFMNGFMVGYMANTINHELSNIQVHHPEFKKDQEVQYNIENGLKKAAKLECDGKSIAMAQPPNPGLVLAREIFVDPLAHMKRCKQL